MSTADRPRPLVGPVRLVLLAFAFGATLMLLSPKLSQIEKRVARAPSSAASVPYLELLAANHPANVEIRFELARRLRDGGRYERAIERLAPLMELPTETGLEARVLAAEILHSRIVALPASDARRRTEYVELRNRLLALSSAVLTRTTLERLVRIALAHGDPDTAAILLAETGRRTGDPALLLRAARVDIEAARPDRAARDRLAAASLLPPARALRTSLDAIAELRAANRPVDALAEAVRLLDEFPEDETLWKTALDLALSAEDPVLAANIGRERLRRTRATAALLDAQIALELGANRPDGALPFAERLVGLAPDEFESRRRVIELATWSARIRVAYAQERWLAFHGSDRGDFANAVARSRALEDYDTTVALLELDAKRSEGPAAAVELAELYEYLGHVVAAHEALNFARDRAPSDRTLWERLAALELRMGAEEKAVTTLAEMHGRFAPEPAELDARAILLARLGREEEALALLSSAPYEPSAERLRHVGEIAYTIDDYGTAIAAYDALFARGEASPAEAERLHVALRALGRGEAAFDVAIAAYDRWNEPKQLLAAGFLAVEQDDERLAYVLGRAESDRGPLEATPEYWLLRGEEVRRRIATAFAGENVEDATLALADGKELVRKASVLHGDLTVHPVLRGLSRSVGGWETQLFALRDYVARRNAAAADAASSSAAVWRLANEGHDADAIHLAHSRLAIETDEVERNTLRRQIEWLAERSPRLVEASGMARTIGDVLEAGGGATLILSGDRVGFTLAGTVRELIANGNLASVESDVTEGEASAGVRARDAHGLTEASVGVIVRGSEVLPTGTLRHERRIADRMDLAGLLVVNSSTVETSYLRIAGARDAFGARTTVDLTDRWFVAGGALAERYVDLDRNRLGRGLTFDTAVGYRVLTGARTLNVRAVGLVAPRFSDAAPPSTIDVVRVVPNGAGFVGFASTLARGDMRVGAPYSTHLRYFVEASLGLIVPMNQVGYRAYAGIGIPGLGRGELRVVADVTNVIGASPGRLRAGLALQYAYGLWR